MKVTLLLKEWLSLKVFWLKDQALAARGKVGIFREEEKVVAVDNNQEILFW
jgi:hypothetical protein